MSEMQNTISFGSGPEVIALLFQRQFLVRNKEHDPATHAEFHGRVHAGKGQDPSALLIGCGDSFCAGYNHELAETIIQKTGSRPSTSPINGVFTGDAPLNPLFMRLPSGSVTTVPSAGYFLNHLVPHGKRPMYGVFVEGHTLCGGANAVYANGENFPLPVDEKNGGLHMVLNFPLEGLKEYVHSLKSTSDENVRKAFPNSSQDADTLRLALLSQANVDLQIEKAMEVYGDLDGKVMFLGVMRDLTGDIYAPDTPQFGDVFITNVNGITDVNEISSLLTDKCGQYGLTQDAVEYSVRRLSL